VLINRDFIRSLQAELHLLLASESTLGPLTARFAAPSWLYSDNLDEHGLSRNATTAIRELAVTHPCDLDDEGATVGTFFGLDLGRKRGFFESDAVALIAHHLSGALIAQYPCVGLGENHVEALCGRCFSATTSNVFKSCHVAVVGGALLLNGACTDCHMDMGNATCSFSRKCFLNVFQRWFMLTLS
jgi:hypothetical protein